jgi:hypothetical protein
MNGKAFATMMVLALAAGGAQAGTLKAGTWEPTGCGMAPTPPTINGSSRAAYEASIKEANAYQATAKQYEDCYFKEAQADNNTISTALNDHQNQTKATFEKLQSEANAAAARLNKK